MLPLEDIRLYLPKYLSPKSTDNLFEELKQFPENIDKRLYSKVHEYKDKILQGDGLINLPVINLPESTIKDVPVMVISNSCDNDPENSRFFDSRVCYCPVFKLNKYKNILLESGEKSDKVDSHISSIRKQRIAQIFYLPSGAGLEEESFVFFSKVVSCDSDIIFQEKKNKNKIFSLSNYGIYLFVFKLSIYFTRLNEGIDRNKET
jgi:hypothetical protein